MTERLTLLAAAALLSLVATPLVVRAGADAPRSEPVAVAAETTVPRRRRGAGVPERAGGLCRVRGAGLRAVRFSGPADEMTPSASFRGRESGARNPDAQFLENKSARCLPYPQHSAVLDPGLRLRGPG